MLVGIVVRIGRIVAVVAANVDGLIEQRSHVWLVEERRQLRGAARRLAAQRRRRRRRTQLYRAPLHRARHGARVVARLVGRRRRVQRLAPIGARREVPARRRLLAARARFVERTLGLFALQRALVQLAVLLDRLASLRCVLPRRIGAQRNFVQLGLQRLLREQSRLVLGLNALSNFGQSEPTKKASNQTVSNFGIFFKQNKTQNKTKQNKTKQNKTKQNKTNKQTNTKQNKTKQTNKQTQTLTSSTVVI